MHPTTKYDIRERLLEFIYPHTEYIRKHLIEYNEIKQHMNNMMNLCTTVNEMYEVLPPTLHTVLRSLVGGNWVKSENSIRFMQEYLEFKQKSIEVDKKLSKLLALKIF